MKVAATNSVLELSTLESSLHVQLRSYVRCESKADAFYCRLCGSKVV